MFIISSCAMATSSLVTWRKFAVSMTGRSFMDVDRRAFTLNVGQAETSIPDWIKNNAGWWADGQIDDNSFVSGLQWLISNGIMKIS